MVFVKTRYKIKQIASTWKEKTIISWVSGVLYDNMTRKYDESSKPKHRCIWEETQNGDS